MGCVLVLYVDFRVVFGCVIFRVVFAKKLKEKLEKFFEFTLSFFLSDVEFLIFLNG